MDYMNDLGAPIAVAVADIVTLTKKPTWNKWFHYGGVVLGYGLPMLNVVPGKYNGLLKNIGIASLPLAARNLYNDVVKPVPAITASPIINRMVTYPSPVARTYEPEFKKVGTV